jgi:predicted dehydrogenase
LFVAYDVDKPRPEEAVLQMGGKAGSDGDCRRSLERKDVGAVLDASPDHCHSPIMVDAFTASGPVGPRSGWL